MKERPILFSAPMVRALLDGSKTQARRLVKPAPEMVAEKRIEPWSGNPADLLSLLLASKRGCPYGQQGDRLWVREAYADIGCRLTYRADEDDGARFLVRKWTPSIHMFRADSRILLEIVSVRVERLNDISEADAVAEGIECVANNFGNGPAYRDYRMKNPEDTSEWLSNPVTSYKTLWESINGAGSWAANPWCWVVEFKRVMP